MSFGSKDKPFGSWVSENSLAYLRIIKCIYGILDDILDDDEVTESIIYLLNMWQATVSRIMQSVVNDDLINDTERHIKMFLSTLRDIENCYDLEEGTTKNKKSFLQSTANLNGLLNLPDYMRAYGPLRLYWEGSCIGEGIIKDIKPCITQGVHKPTFAQNALRRYYIDKFYQSMTNTDIVDDDESTQSLETRYSDFRTYKNKQIVEDLLQHKPYGSAISLIILNDGKLCVSCINKGNHTATEILTDDKNGSFWYGTWITSMELGNDLKLTKNDLRNRNKIKTYALALPSNSNKANKTLKELKKLK